MGLTIGCLFIEPPQNIIGLFPLLRSVVLSDRINVAVSTNYVAGRSWSPGKCQGEK